MKYLLISLLFLTLSSAQNCHNQADQSASKSVQKDLSGLHKAYFASGCFWCVEAVFESVIGVEEALSGYTGGTVSDPTYESVSAGTTDHAEAVEVYYDTTLIDYPTLLKVFFGSHDPTTLNRQGPDAGTQYRSGVYYQNKQEKELAEKYMKELKEAAVFSGAITTELAPLGVFYPAEEYHQDYEMKNPNNPYVRAVSVPRLRKFQKAYPDLLKEGHH